MTKTARLDHDRFEFRTLREPSGLRLPNEKSVAVLLTVPIEFFPLDPPAAPFRPSGALDRQYPDYWDYANRDYGNRVGVYRLLRAFGELRIAATALVDAEVVGEYPEMMRAVGEAGWEFAASGVDRGALHYGDMPAADEAARVAKALSAVQSVSAHRVTGWQSPAQSESFGTLDVLAEAGVRWVSDWVNDDVPYEVKTSSGKGLISVPSSFELSDRNALFQHDFTVDEYKSQVIDAFEQLCREATPAAPRVLPLALTPWVSGYPHRIGAVREMLREIAASESAVFLTCGALADRFEGRGHSSIMKED
jgi:allantoinase